VQKQAPPSDFPVAGLVSGTEPNQKAVGPPSVASANYGAASTTAPTAASLLVSEILLLATDEDKIHTDKRKEG
jgi:hypothetical protein